ncbi:MAG: hypothetical protein M1115_05025 [Actinobacteria bacterium]|nr:hypothetical protein [Actinomycetota bacterium]
MTRPSQGQVMPGPVGKVAIFLGIAIVVGFASFYVSGLERYTWGARFGTFGCALGVLVIGAFWQHYRFGASSGSQLFEPNKPPHGDASERGALVWLVVPSIAAVWDILGLLTPPNEHHLTLSALELAYRPLHAVLFALWLGLGWALAAVPLNRKAVPISHIRKEPRS